MMRNFFLFLLISITIFSAKAEVGVAVGGRAGFNITNLRKFSAPETFKKRVSLGSDIAAVLRIDFNKYISLQTEIEFTQKGQAWKRREDTAKYFSKIVLNYIQFPILAVGRFGNDKVKGIVQLGPYLGYWAGGYTQNSVAIDKVTRSATTDKYLFTKNDMRLDVGLVAGVGADVKVGKGWIEVGARYNVGFLSISKKNSGLPKLYNSNFSLSVGYLYTIK